MSAGPVEMMMGGPFGAPMGMMLPDESMPGMTISFGDPMGNDGAVMAISGSLGDPGGA